MNMNTKWFLIVLAFVLAVPAYSLMAQEAESDSETTTGNQLEDRMQSREERIQQRQEKREEIKEARLEKRCEIVQIRLQNKSNQMTNNKDMYVRIHSIIIQRLERLRDLFKAKELNVDALNVEITTLSEKMATIKEAYEKSISTIENAESASCQETQEAFKTRMENARSEVAGIKSLRVDIREYIKNTVKPTLQGLRAQLSGEDEEDSEEATASGESE